MYHFLQENKGKVLLSIFLALFFVPSAFAMEPLNNGNSPTGSFGILGLDAQSVCGPATTTWTGNVNDYCLLPAGETMIFDSPDIYVNNASAGSRTYVLGISINAYNPNGTTAGTFTTSNFCITASVSAGSAMWSECSGSYSLAASSSDRYIRASVQVSRGGGGSQASMQLATYNDASLFSSYPSEFPPNNVWLFTGYGTDLVTSSFDCYSGVTRICNFTPEDGVTLSTTTVNFSLEAYVNPSDVTTLSRVQIRVVNINQNILGYISDLVPFLSNVIDPYTFVVLNDTDVPSGSVTWDSGPLVFPAGNYRVEACIGKNFLGINNFLPDFLGGLNCESHQYIVVAPTFIGNISQTSFNGLNSILASTSATSTLALAGTCSPISTNAATLFLNVDFSIINCLSFLFVPDSQYVSQTVNDFKLVALSHFPLGYFSDFYYLISTSTVSQMPIFSAVVPPGIPGTGASISLDLNGVLDPYLNATTSQFINVSASSSDTLLDITMPYWELFVNFAVIFYVVGRIVGGSFIPRIISYNNQTRR